MRERLSLIALSVMALLAGCAAGPDYAGAPDLGSAQPEAGQVAKLLQQRTLVRRAQADEVAHLCRPALAGRGPLRGREIQAFLCATCVG
mgnify:CR=1 FL=1